MGLIAAAAPQNLLLRLTTHSSSATSASEGQQLRRSVTAWLFCGPLLFLQGSVDNVVWFVQSVINFYMWIFTSLMGVAQNAFGAVSGEPPTCFLCCPSCACVAAIKYTDNHTSHTACKA